MKFSRMQNGSEAKNEVKEWTGVTNVCIGIQSHTEWILLYIRRHKRRMFREIHGGLQRHLQSLAGEFLTCMYIQHMKKIP